MSAMNFLTSPLIILIGTLIAMIVLWRTLSARPSYQPTSLMTANEWEFFNRLRVAVPEAQIFPQVGMAALITPKRRMGRSVTRDFYRIAAKRLDYAVCNAHGQLICVIELDDRTHDQHGDRARDAWLASAGITCRRWHSRAKPTRAEIRRTILGLAGDLLPRSPRQNSWA